MAQQNADFSQRFLCYASDGVTPLVVSGTSLRMDIKDAPGAVPAATFSTSGGNLTIESPPNSNAFDLYIPAATMATFQAERYWWDILQTTAGGLVNFLGGGYWNITTGITNTLTPNLPNYGGLNPQSIGGITLTAYASSLVLELQPSGPAGPQGPTGPALGPVHATVSAATTLTSAAWFWPVNAVSGNVIMSVPFGSGLPNQIFSVKKIDATGNTVTVQMSGADTLDASASYALTSTNQFVNFANQAGGNTWFTF